MRNAVSTSDVLTDALSITGTTVFSGNGGSYSGVVPNNNYKWATFIATKRGSGIRVIGFAEYGGAAINTYDGSSWNGWQELALNSNFAEVSAEVSANSNVTVAYPTGFNRSNSNAMMGYINISGNKYFDSTKAGIVFGSEGIILYNHDSSTRTIGCGIIRTT